MWGLCVYVCDCVCAYTYILSPVVTMDFLRVWCAFRCVCAHIIIMADINISCTRLFYSRRDARASARSLNAEFYSNSHIFITILSFLIASRSAFRFGKSLASQTVARNILLYIIRVQELADNRGSTIFFVYIYDVFYGIVVYNDLLTV